ncbi:MAG TPA: DNA-processing protein DprA [Polyangiaceae bacterium]|nr:DNA-processing protein DprA [Polyangiaceae bacterium]
MHTPQILVPGDPCYPHRLAELDPPVPEITVSNVAGLFSPGPVVAIVGTRTPAPEAESYAATLAAECVLAGAVVVSGGAIGIDAAAHRGALDAGGPTWAILPTGCDKVSPPEHAEFFEHIGAGGGTLVWPFPKGQVAQYQTYFARNRVLVALADAVVVVQAGIPSGALNAAKHARRLGRPLWVVSPPAWDSAFAGSLQLIELGARPLTRPRQLLRSLGLRACVTPADADIQPRRPRTPSQRTAEPSLELFPQQSFAWSKEAQAVFQVAECMPLHIDELIGRAGLPAATVSTALLTLALENVLVEGPNGCFRRAEEYKHQLSLNILPKDADNDGEDARSRRIARQGEDDQEVPGGSLRRTRIEGAR